PETPPLPYTTLFRSSGLQRPRPRHRRLQPQPAATHPQRAGLRHRPVALRPPRLLQRRRIAHRDAPDQPRVAGGQAGRPAFPFRSWRKPAHRKLLQVHAGLLCRPGQQRRIHLPQPMDRHPRAVQRALLATPAMRKRVLSSLLLLVTSTAWADETALRLKDLQRCGDLFAANELTYCLRGEGLGEGDLSVMLRGKPVTVQREKRNRLRLTLNEKDH